jgi:hypothetical protein
MVIKGRWGVNFFIFPSSHHQVATQSCCKKNDNYKAMGIAAKTCYKMPKDRKKQRKHK